MMQNISISNLIDTTMANIDWSQSHEDIKKNISNDLRSQLFSIREDEKNELIKCQTHLISSQNDLIASMKKINVIEESQRRLIMSYNGSIHAGTFAFARALIEGRLIQVEQDLYYSFEALRGYYTADSMTLDQPSNDSKIFLRQLQQSDLYYRADMQRGILSLQHLIELSDRRGEKKKNVLLGFIRDDIRYYFVSLDSEGQNGISATVDQIKEAFSSIYDKLSTVTHASSVYRGEALPVPVCIPGKWEQEDALALGNFYKFSFPQVKYQLVYSLTLTPPASE
ncbi:unnamed protein product [Didymodactylos carnosus]|uniref:Uncharacterized protein n=1 Tax=Didymodactylos carnosus TaxID=1234261 RepID=A0A8S2FNE3_9BILA|nr:unnamed protein product [Didymodactylos carnosus]CAF4304460.1 unnamed protein product [Didymodactylos carnosus]